MLYEVITRRQLFAKSLRFPLSYFDKKPIGVTLSRLTSDMGAISESFAAGILGLLSDRIKTAALAGYLFYLNWQLTVITSYSIHYTKLYDQNRVERRTAGL